MAPHPHCDREGGRACPGPKTVEIGVPEEQAEAKREHDWEALDKLKLKKS